MRTRLKPVVITVAALALGAAPALATGRPSDPGSQGRSTASTHTSTTHTATPPSEAKAFGLMCLKAGTSKQHVAGMKGTPFSACVTALAKVHSGRATTASACSTEARTHVAGETGTPFSQCKSAAAKMLRSEHHT